MADLRRIARLVQQQAAARSRLSARLVRSVRRLWQPTSPDSWYDPTWIERQAQRSADLSRIAQLSWADQAVKYLDLVTAEFDGMPGSAIGSDVRSSMPAELRGVEPAVLWERPASTYRFEVSRGTDVVAAQDRALLRAELLADMDVQLADREATAQVLLDLADGGDGTGAPAITGYRRIVHPELSKGGVCGLCLAAADRIYKVDDLRAVHDRCECTVLPVTEEEDPGLDLNSADIKRLYEAAGSTGRQDLAAVRFVVHEHGELGPVLRRADDRFRSEGDAEEDLDPSRFDLAPWRHTAAS